MDVFTQERNCIQLLSEDISMDTPRAGARPVWRAEEEDHSILLFWQVGAWSLCGRDLMRADRDEPLAVPRECEGSSIISITREKGLGNSFPNGFVFRPIERL